MLGLVPGLVNTCTAGRFVSSNLNLKGDEDDRPGLTVTVDGTCDGHKGALLGVQRSPLISQVNWSRSSCKFVFSCDIGRPEVLHFGSKYLFHRVLVCFVKSFFGDGAAEAVHYSWFSWFRMTLKAALPVYLARACS